jgi:hypothetical protein
LNLQLRQRIIYLYSEESEMKIAKRSDLIKLVNIHLIKFPEVNLPVSGPKASEYFNALQGIKYGVDGASIQDASNKLAWCLGYSIISE